MFDDLKASGLHGGGKQPNISMHELGAVPSKPVFWSYTKMGETEIHSLKVVGQNPAPVPIGSRTVSPTTQGVPRNLVSMKVNQRITSASTKELSVSFKRDPADSNYSSANILVQTGGNQPVIVAAAEGGPTKITIARNSLPTTVHVQPV